MMEDEEADLILENGIAEVADGATIIGGEAVVDIMDGVMETEVHFSWIYKEKLNF